MQELSKEDLAKAESGGFPIVLLILLVVFGSLAAALLPLALGFISVMVTGALIYFISLEMSTSVFVTNMASMIGIGVAIDYSLFVLARYREEREAGRDPDEARAQALSTSGLAVTFSGLAVIISLGGLWMVDNQALRSMALGAMTVVAVSILTAVTLLPALIAMLGDRVMPGGIVARVLGCIKAPSPGGANRTHEPGTFWERWTTRVMARPWLVGDRGGLGPPRPRDPGALDRDRHRGDQAVPEGQRRQGRQRTRLRAARRRHRSRSDHRPLRGRPGPCRGRLVRARARAPPPGSPRSPRPSSPAKRSSSRRRRAPAASPTPRSPCSTASATRWSRPPTLASVARVDVGGETARGNDIRVQISGSMWKIILFVLALSFLVLMVMLRSIVIPLKAVMMNLLSIGAAYGVLVAIFQWGWFDSLLGFENQGALDTINVPLIFAVVFGLSMDYEVFLMSRIRERYMAHGDNERAVAEGLSSSARTISSAALIMTCVFSVFVLTGVPSIKELGLGCAVAIALDATLVRLILVPAAMKLLGAWNWWMPSWLDRILPRLNFEDGAAEPEPAEA